VNKNIPFPKTHILEILKQKCVEIDDSFQDIDFKNLSQYAVEIRFIKIQYFSLKGKINLQFLVQENLERIKEAKKKIEKMEKRI
jgi:hypothetical protein